MTNSIESENLLKTAASRMRAVREKLKLKQVDFANQLGISQSYLSIVESGKRKPSFELMFSLLTRFNVDLPWVLTGQGEMFIKTNQGSSFMGASFMDLFPEVTLTGDLIDLIKSLEVPIMRNALLSKYFYYLEKYREIISDYYEKKEKEPDPQTDEDQGIGKKN
jgi:transcriptional regulator with XRE-family HTH domain